MSLMTSKRFPGCGHRRASRVPAGIALAVALCAAGLAPARADERTSAADAAWLAAAGADSGTTLIAHERAVDVPAPPTATDLARLRVALSSASRTRVLTEGDARVVHRVQVAPEGIRWTVQTQRLDAPSGFLPWSEVRAIDVRGTERVGTAIGGGFVGTLAGGAAGALVGYAVVGGDMSDMNAIAPVLFGLVGGAAGLLVGTIWGAVEGTPSGAWERVYERALVTSSFGATDSAVATPEGGAETPPREEVEGFAGWADVRLACQGGAEYRLVSGGRTLSCPALDVQREGVWPTDGDRVTARFTNVPLVPWRDVERIDVRATRPLTVGQRLLGGAALGSVAGVLVTAAGRDDSAMTGNAVMGGLAGVGLAYLTRGANPTPAQKSGWHTVYEAAGREGGDAR